MPRGSGAVGLQALQALRALISMTQFDFWSSESPNCK